MTRHEIRTRRERTDWLSSTRHGIPEVLTLWTDGMPLSWLLLSLEGIVLIGGALGPMLILTRTWADAATLRVTVSRSRYEFLVLGLLVLFWCGWCEGGYRLSQQMGSLGNVPWQRRMTLELWTGLLFSLLLSFLTALSSILPLVGVFLLFSGIESLKASGSGRTLRSSVLLGFRESFRTVSLDPLRLFTLLVVPGILLYLTSLLLRIAQIRLRDLILLTPESGRTLINATTLGIAILLLGLLGASLFIFARIDLMMGYLRIQQIQTLDPSPQPRGLFNRVRVFSRIVVVMILLALALFCLYELIVSGLFNRSFFYRVLESCVGVVNGYVQSFIDLLAKLAFIIASITLIVGLFVLLVNIAKGNANGILGRSLSFLGGRVRRFTEFISNQVNLPGQAIQITTLLSAVGLIATQTYTRIMEAQSLRLEQQRRQEQQLTRQQQRKQSYAARAENQIIRFQNNLQSLVNGIRSESDWLDLDRRGQVASLTRDLARELQDPDGGADGQRRARVIKYLYDSRFLIQNEYAVPANKSTCPDALSLLLKQSKSPRTLITLPQLVLDRQLIYQTNQIRTNPGSNCQLARLVPLGMDFSHANLKDAFLINVALPFINLSHADLRNAQLRNADLRFANLKNANLKGADLRGARLDYAYLANSDISSARIDNNTSFFGAVSFYSTRNSDLKNSLSWELTQRPGEKKNLLWCPLDFRMDPAAGEGKPRSPEQPIVQADAKCDNRPFSGYKRKSDLIQNRNWASGNFRGTIIENFRLNHIDFTSADLGGAVFRFVQLNDVDFTGANLEGTRFEDSVLNNVNFTGANIRRMVFRGSSVERLTFRGAQYVLPVELGDYADDLLLVSGRNMDNSPTSNQSPPARLAQRLLLPLVLAPFPLRPSRMLIWIIPYSPELLFASQSRQSIP